MSDLRDKRGGAYDPVSEEGNPQPPQVREKPTPHEQAEGGADVRPEPVPGPEEPYPTPDGLRRDRKGPMDKDVGRRGDTVRGH